MTKIDSMYAIGKYCLFVCETPKGKYILRGYIMASWQEIFILHDGRTVLKEWFVKIEEEDNAE